MVILTSTASSPTVRDDQSRCHPIGAGFLPLDVRLGALGEGMENNEHHTPPILLRVPDAARALGIGRSLTYELIAAGDIEVVYVGSVIRVPVDALTSFVERRRVTDTQSGDR